MMVRLSVPIPINCFGIEQPHGDADFVPKSGFPAVAAGQRYVFCGGQYAGLESKIGDRLEARFSYRYRDPIGINRHLTNDVVLSVEHLRRMPSRTSASQAIVDALKGPNKTTIQEIRDAATLRGDHPHCAQDRQLSQTFATFFHLDHAREGWRQVVRTHSLGPHP